MPAEGGAAFAVKQGPPAEDAQTMNELQIDFEQFYPYEALCAHIRALAEWKPDMAAVRVLGKSPEGREVLLLEITNTPENSPVPGRASARDKPIFLVHGNLHAGELSGSTCALYLAYCLLAHAPDDPAVDALLDRVTFHIVPRVSPDGAEEVLVRGHAVRSRETVEKRKNCICPQDLDGDGQIRAMRVPDPQGAWFAPDDEPRLLVPRLPGDASGRRYRLTTEGLIHDWDGGPWEEPAATGFDFNRNWAGTWRPRHEQWGAGRYPFSEAEVRALADHVFDHPNVFGMFGLHNGANAILRPPTASADSELDGADLFAFRRFAALGETITGFPAKAIHEYRNDLAAPIRLYGTFTEWGYRHCGLFAMEIELGNLYNGIGYDTARIFQLSPEDERQRERDVLAWHDAHPDAGVFVDWQPFEHPQLGPVEIGGITPVGLYNVIPEHRLEVWEKTRHFILELARCGPRLEIPQVSVEPLGHHLFRVACRVANEGHLPTHVTALGAGLTHIDGVRVEIESSGALEFIANRSRTELGHLRASEYRELDWVLRAPAATVITIVAHAPRAGRCEIHVPLEP